MSKTTINLDTTVIIVQWNGNGMPSIKIQKGEATEQVFVWHQKDAAQIFVVVQQAEGLFYYANIIGITQQVWTATLSREDVVLMSSRKHYRALRHI